MQPFYITVGKTLDLMIIPDSQAHADGHAVLTYTYSVYNNKGGFDVPAEKDSSLHLDKNTDPTYMGFITFEQPGRIFNYTPDGMNRLDEDEVEEVIEQISHYRDTPSLWTI